MSVIVGMRLAKLILDRGFNRRGFSLATKINEARLRALCDGHWSYIKQEELERIVAVLDCTPNELFGFEERDLFFGPRRGGALEIHLSSRFMRNGDASDVTTSTLTPQALNAWDIQSFVHIWEYATACGIRVVPRLHTPNNLGWGTMPTVNDLFEDHVNSHIVVGSQLSGDLTERTVCRMYGVPPFDERRRKAFPMNIRWETLRAKSSFGFSDGDTPLGIYSTKGGEIIAHRTLIGPDEGGEGDDCGLIVSYRLPCPSPDGQEGVASERSIVVLAGHGGPGTLGCAHVLTQRDLAGELYPESSGQPRMRAVRSVYQRPILEGAGNIDNRMIVGAELVPES